MSDIRCAVCGEPWDQYGVNHGDMTWWQADLFKKGAGCPCCEGVQPNGEHLEEHLSDVVFNSEDPDSFDRLHALDEKVEWKEPSPKVLWTCAGCGVKATVSNNAPYDGAKVNEDDVFLEWGDGERVHWMYGHGPFRYGALMGAKDPSRNPSFLIGDKPYCPGCARLCDGCDTPIFSRSELYNDTNDAGASFPCLRDHMQSICLSCFEMEESEDE